MSEYYMSHTGSQLDDAIGKVLGGYILPSGTIDISANADSIDVSEYEKANVNVPVPSGYIKTPTASMSITANGTYDVTNCASANVQVPLCHCAAGFKTCSAGESFEVTGITDSNGVSFTPKGYAFMLAPNVTANTNITNSTNGLIYCFYDVEENVMYRTILYNGTYTVRVNPSVSSGVVGQGSFKQAASSNATYNVLAQRYYWIAWG